MILRRAQIAKADLILFEYYYLHSASVEYMQAGATPEQWHGRQNMREPCKCGWQLDCSIESCQTFDGREGTQK